MTHSKRNIFTGYKQAENQFTNGLFSLLDLSVLLDSGFPNRFLKDLCHIDVEGQMEFFVLRGSEQRKEKKQMIGRKVTVDGEVVARQAYVAFETKISAGSLREDQVAHHLQTAFHCHAQPTKRLVLLTPDNRSSQLVKDCIASCAPKCVALGLDPKRTIVHLRWMDVYNYLKEHGKNVNDRLFVKLVEEYLATIYEMIICQDFVGIIFKAALNDKTGMHCPEDVIAVLTKIEGWGMPKPKPELESDVRNRRKLLIYTGRLKAIYCEAEVQGYKEDHECEPEFPYRYQIRPGSVMRFDPPIPLSKIRDIQTLENLGTLRGYVRVRSDVYEQLVKGENKVRVQMT